MKAVFKKSFRYLFILFLTLDLMWTGLFVFFLVNGMRAVGDIVLFSVITLIYYALAVILFLYNRKAYLQINDNRIVGKFGFFRRLDCDISEVTFVLVQNDTIHIVLKDQKYHVVGIKNAYAIGALIQQKMPFSPCEATKEAVESIKKRIRSRKKNIILVFCMAGLSLVWLLAAFPLIDTSKEFSDFIPRDWWIFAILCALELATLITMFVLAVRTRKGNLQLEKQIYEIKRSAMETTPLLWGPGELRAVLAYPLYSQRVTVYSGCVENDPLSTCCRVESFDEKYQLKFLYQTEPCTVENLDESFQGLIDLTDKFTKKNL